MKLHVLAESIVLQSSGLFNWTKSGIVKSVFRLPESVRRPLCVNIFVKFRGSCNRPWPTTPKYVGENWRHGYDEHEAFYQYCDIQGLGSGV